MSKPKSDKKFEVPGPAIKELLTASELRMLNNRWQIIQLLEEGLPVREVAEKVKVGTDTVVRVAKMLDKEGLKKLLQKKELTRPKTSWIFGKSND